MRARNIESISDFHIDNLRSANFSNILTEKGILGEFAFKESNKYWDFSKGDFITHLPEYKLWHHHIPLTDIAISGEIVRGFKRGSR